MKDRGLAAYIAELVGTMFLVLTIGVVLSMYAAPGTSTAFSTDFAVIGLVHGFALFMLIAGLGPVSGGHFNPAVTLVAVLLKKIDAVDAIAYVLTQLVGAILGALIVKGLLLDEGLAGNYGATAISPLLANSFAAFVVELIGTFLLVTAVITTEFGQKAKPQFAPFAIGMTLAFLVMIFGPLTGAGFNPARWFGPALIGDAFNGFAGVWPYLLGPGVGALLAFGFYRGVLYDPNEGDGAAA